MIDESSPAETGYAYQHTRNLNLVSTAQSDAEDVGTVYALEVESGNDNRVAAAFNGSITAGAGTLRMYLLTSHEGKKWQVVAVSSTLDTNGRQEVFEIEEPTYLLKYVAATFEATGGASYRGSIGLVATSPLKLIDASALDGLVTPSLDLVVIPSGSTAERKAGRAAVAIGDTTVAVVFDTPMTNANYTIALAQDTAVGIWYTAKTRTGFTAHIAAIQAAEVTIDWHATADS